MKLSFAMDIVFTLGIFLYNFLDNHFVLVQI